MVLIFLKKIYFTKQVNENRDSKSMWSKGFFFRPLAFTLDVMIAWAQPHVCRGRACQKERIKVIKKKKGISFSDGKSFSLGIGDNYTKKKKKMYDTRVLLYTYLQTFFSYFPEKPKYILSMFDKILQLLAFYLFNFFFQNLKK